MLEDILTLTKEAWGPGLPALLFFEMEGVFVNSRFFRENIVSPSGKLWLIFLKQGNVISKIQVTKAVLVKPVYAIGYFNSRPISGGRRRPPCPKTWAKKKAEAGSRGSSSRQRSLRATALSRQRMSGSQFNKGPSYGLSAEVRNRLAQKYDPQKESELREWIEGITGREIGPDFQKGLKDGVILCELINLLQPGSVRKINRSALNWHQVCICTTLIRDNSLNTCFRKLETF
ncbi:calponin-2 [Sphaerodactylus townsendi]|uniref:calponin-2 n=1 Tax=Sphaerodactylus townsendi TaxID=933632 RepID=UPI002026E43A|nr:calponin-2 [Sphaerodactylus townsendi]